MNAVLEQFNLNGRNFVITGASSGIGRAMAEFLAQAGAGVGGADDMDDVKRAAGDVEDARAESTYDCVLERGCRWNGTSGFSACRHSSSLLLWRSIYESDGMFYVDDSNLPACSNVNSWGKQCSHQLVRV